MKGTITLITRGFLTHWSNGWTRAVGDSRRVLPNTANPLSRLLYRCSARETTMTTTTTTTAAVGSLIDRFREDAAR